MIRFNIWNNTNFWISSFLERVQVPFPWIVRRFGHWTGPFRVLNLGYKELFDINLASPHMISGFIWEIFRGSRSLGLENIIKPFLGQQTKKKIVPPLNKCVNIDSHGPNWLFLPCISLVTKKVKFKIQKFDHSFGHNSSV